MKAIARFVYYSITFVLLTLAFSYMHLEDRFTKEVMSTGKATPTGDQIYGWQNHGLVYLNYKDAFIAQNQFLVWIVIVLVIGIFSSVLASLLGLRFQTKKELRKKTNAQRL